MNETETRRDEKLKRSGSLRLPATLVVVLLSGAAAAITCGSETDTSEQGGAGGIAGMGVSSVDTGIGG